jgi:hypothetical protein
MVALGESWGARQMQRMMPDDALLQWMSHEIAALRHAIRAHIDAIQAEQKRRAEPPRDFPSAPRDKRIG